MESVRKMNDIVFKLFITVLSIALMIVVIIITAEIIAHRRPADKYRPQLKYLRSYKDGFTFSDNDDLSKAIQVMYITSDYIEFSDTGINGRFDRIWER
jgi:hypothetical protein